LSYFENEDYHQIVGNIKQASYTPLLQQGSVLSQFYAEEHPSDGNYLAVAGGSTFGIPLDDPEEENPLYTINARNIGDLVGTAHETWKAYLQSANGPCDDTAHGYYRNDDQPMMYFADVRNRPSYCAAHVVPLEALPSDLASTATTPNYASATVTPVNLTSRKAGKAIKVGTGPQAVAVTPNGRTACVANSGSDTVTPINTATDRAGPAIPVGTDPTALAVTPNGRWPPHPAGPARRSRSASTPIPPSWPSPVPPPWSWTPTLARSL